MKSILEISKMNKNTIENHLIDLRVKRELRGLSESEKLTEIYMYASLIDKTDSVSRIQQKYDNIYNKASDVINRRAYI